MAPNGLTVIVRSLAIVAEMAFIGALLVVRLGGGDTAVCRTIAAAMVGHGLLAGAVLTFTSWRPPRRPACDGPRVGHRRYASGYAASRCSRARLRRKPQR